MGTYRSATRRKSSSFLTNVSLKKSNHFVIFTNTADLRGLLETEQFSLKVFNNYVIGFTETAAGMHKLTHVGKQKSVSTTGDLIKQRILGT